MFRNASRDVLRKQRILAYLEARVLLVFVKPSPKESPVAVNMRVLVLQWPERLGSKASKTKEDFLKDWQMDNCSVQFS